MSRQKTLTGIELTFVAAALALITISGACSPRPTPTPAPTATMTPSPWPTLTHTPTPTITPTPAPLAPPSLQGRLIVRSGSDVYELTGDSVTQWDPGGCGGLSPNPRYCLDVTGGFGAQSTNLYDLTTGETITLFPGAPSCLSWATDGSRFSYSRNDTDVHVFDPSSGTDELVYQAPGTTYVVSGQQAGYAGHVTCGTWIGADRFVFQRFVGPLPGRITLPDKPELSANTTTLAVIAETITLVDSPRRLIVLDVSDDGSHILMEGQVGGEADSLYLAPPFGNFEGMDWRSFEPVLVPHCPGCGYKCIGCAVMEFMPDSYDLYFVNHTPDASKYIYFVDSETLEVSEGPALPYSSQGSPLWVGDPKSGLVAFLDLSATLPQCCDVVLMDLSTGQTTVVFSAIEDQDTNILGWLP